jgi:hypothetical protein
LIKTSGSRSVAGGDRHTEQEEALRTNDRLWVGSRRDVLTDAAKIAAGGALTAALSRLSVGRANAQSTPPADMGYPELTVTFNDDAFEVSTNEVPAGYVLMTAVNRTQSTSNVGLLGPGPGKTMQDLMNEADQVLATHQPADSFLPSFFYTATLPGGPGSVPPGGTGQVVVELTAGDWALWGGSESSNPPPVFITATTGTPVTQTAPTPIVTITEVDFAFGGFGQTFPAGKQTWQVVNQGTQPHMLSVAQVPLGTTVADVLESIGQPQNATPSTGVLRREDFQDRGGIITQSPGTTVWPLLDLPAGHYVTLCFVGNPQHGGEPHAMEGMVAVFDVG